MTIWQSRLIKLFALSIFLWGVFGVWADRSVSQADGILVNETPVQKAIEPNRAGKLELKGHTVSVLASYDIKARVIGKERYRWDAGASIVPYDIAVGWGQMSDNKNLRDMGFSQGMRFLNWKRMSLPFEQVNRQLANMHLIAGDSAVANTIAKLRPGQIISMSGYLVEVRRPDGWHWRSSLSRDDTGGGACELMWVERIEVL
jgi:hypothetical protein